MEANWLRHQWVEIYDVISTIDVYIQDIAHHALLKQRLWSRSWLRSCHGDRNRSCERLLLIRKSQRRTYYETTNYAVAESGEPGSTFKLADLMARTKLLTQARFSTQMAVRFAIQEKWLGIPIRGYGKISLARDLNYRQTLLWWKRFMTIIKIIPKVCQSY
jgi:cell division protein FtsI (penicillin-binding protein 3)